MSREYKDTTYNVFCDNVYGSDVVDCSTLAKARKVAKEWSQDSECEVIIERVTTKYIESYRKGKELKQ